MEKIRSRFLKKALKFIFPFRPDYTALVPPPDSIPNREPMTPPAPPAGPEAADYRPPELPAQTLESLETETIEVTAPTPARQSDYTQGFEIKNNLKFTQLNSGDRRLYLDLSSYGSSRGESLTEEELVGKMRPYNRPFRVGDDNGRLWIDTENFRIPENGYINQ